MAKFFFRFLFFSIALGGAIEHSPHDPIRAQSGGGEKLWCVAKNNADDSALQSAVGWACGPGGADCGAIQEGGACYDRSDIIGMASFVFNNYCIKHGMSDETCNFSSTAAPTSLDPSYGDCKFPSSSSSSAGGKFSGSSTDQGINSGSADMSSCSYLGRGAVNALLYLFFATLVAIFL